MEIPDGGCTEHHFQDLSHVLLMEMQKMVDKLQEKMSEELRREMRDMRELMFAEEPGQRPMFASKSISKVTTERSRPPRLPQGKSMHFNPHVWATRHIRRYCQHEDEDEEFEEGGRGPESRNLSRVTSRPSANAEVHPEEKKSRQVSFAVSGKTTEQEIVEETRSLPQVPVLLGKEMQETPAAADSSDTEAAAERIPEIKSQAVDEDINLLCLPGQINKEPSNDASDVVHGDSSKSMDSSRNLSSRFKHNTPPKTKAVSVRRADRGSRVGCESIEVAMGLRAQLSEVNHKLQNLGAGHYCLSRFVRSQKFEYIVVAVIVTHTILVGAQINWMTLNGSADPSLPFRVIDIIVCSFFAMEVALRLVVHGLKFFYMLGWGWNVLDFFLVVAQLVEEALILANKETSGVVDFAVLRIVRTLRFMRIIRVLRLTRFFDDLRRLVACMLYSAKSFIWSVMFVFLLVYIYGLYLTQSVHLHRLEKGPEGQGDAMLDKFFGTVGRSILSLFQALTGGIDWRELVDVLSENMHEVWGLATVFWIAFLILGVMNIITGNFVSAAMERSQSVKDLDNVFQARRLFKSLDIDDSGAITIDEIRRHLESKPVQQFFRTIDVDSSEAEVLFEILDLSGDGSIDKEEFISGCLRLQGTARAVDLLLMTKDTRRGFEQIFFYLKELIQRLESPQDSQLLAPVTPSCKQSGSNSGLS